MVWPAVATVTRMIATVIMNAVSEHIPINAIFFRISICTFQRMFVETKITSNLFSSKKLLNRIIVLTESIGYDVKEGTKS